MSTQVQVIEVNSGESLFSCELKEIDSAYKYAVEMEKLGLDVKVEAIGLPFALSEELGISEEHKKQYLQSLDDEINSHDDSCCTTQED